MILAKASSAADALALATKDTAPVTLIAFTENDNSTLPDETPGLHTVRQGEQQLLLLTEERFTADSQEAAVLLTLPLSHPYLSAKGIT